VTAPSSAESPNNAGLTPPSSAESPKDASVTPLSPAESPKNAGVTPPSSAESVGRVAEERVQQANVESKNRPQENSTGWAPQVFLIAVMATAVLLGIVIHLFMRWRRTLPVLATTNIPNKNLEDEEGTVASETTIGRASEVVMPMSLTFADKMSRLPDQIGPGAETSMSQDSAYSSKIESTNEEVLPRTVLNEASELVTNSSAIENVAQLPKLYAMGTPSEKELQRFKGLMSHSNRDSQEAEFR
jgi:hypothetical protein